MSDSLRETVAARGQGQVQGAETGDAATGVPVTGAVTGAAVQGAGAGRGKVYRRLSEALTDPQRRALGMITMGVSIRDAGEQLGIHRGTIYRWLKSDAYFRAAYNAWQLEQQESCRAALLKAAEKAVARVIQSIPIDPNLAWRMIKELGLVSRLKPLAVKPSRVEMEIALEDHEEESVLLNRIEREVEGHDDVISPRGNLARLMRLGSEAQLAGTQRTHSVSGEPQGEPGPEAPASPEEVSRE